MSGKPQMYSGFHAVEAILRHRPEAVLELFVRDRRAERGDPRLEALCEQARTLGLSIQPARDNVLERHAGPGHQGVVARARPRRLSDERELFRRLDDAEANEATPMLLVLDGIMDPHNLGACLRSADGAGVHAVILPRRHACGLTPVACRIAVGAAESLACYQVGNLAGVLDGLRERAVRVVGTARGPGSVPVDQLERDSAALAVVMGAEDRGMRPAVRERCDQLVEIPMKGEVESLNVSVATGIVLYTLAPDAGRRSL